MSFFQEQVQRWEWSYGLDDGVFAGFIERVELIQMSFKEVISINKLAVSFFKRSTSSVVDWNWKGWEKHQSFHFMDDYLMELDVSGDNSDCGLKEHHEVKQDQDWIVNFVREDVQEVDLLLKETLVIKKEITKFIRACVTSKIEQKKLSKLLSISRKPDLMLDLLQIASSKVFVPSLRQIPEQIQVDKESDYCYLDEALTSYNTIDQDKSNDDQQIAQLNSYDNFQIEIIQIFETSTTSTHSVFDVWNATDLDEDKNYFDSLNNHILDESLEKGAIYKIDLPFMNTGPTFKESLTAFEFSNTYLFPNISFKFLKELVLKQVLNVTDESNYIDEEMVSNTIFFEEVPIHEFSIVREMTPFLIVESNEVVPFIPRVDPVEVSISNLSVVQDSNLEVIDKTKIPPIIDENAEISQVNYSSLDSIVATKMDSFIDHKKRSLDDELKDIISAKKRQKSGNTNDKPTIFSAPILNLLRDGYDFGEANETTNTSSIAKPASIIDSELLECEHTIIINSSKLTKVARLLNYIDNELSLKVIEYDLTETDPDFIISSTSSILIFDVATISQVDDEGKYINQDFIIENKVKYPDLIVLITISESFFSFEQLLNFQLSLSLMSIQTVISGSTSEDVCLLIANIALSQSKNLEDKEIQLIESPEVTFLSSCGVNPFLSIEILQKMSLPQFITLNNEQRSQIKNINQQLNEYLLNIFTITWDID